MQTERTLLIQSKNLNFPSSTIRNKNDGLSIFFAIVCIVDVFGVFPIVALPKAVIDCGYYGVLLIVVVCSIQIYTAILLGRCWIMAEELDPSITKKMRYPYTALSQITYGDKLANFVTVLVDFTVFCAGIPNLIVASQNLQLFGLRLTDENLNISFCYWILVLGTLLCPILWLGSPKDMKCLCTISVIIVVSVFLLVNGSVLYDNAVPPPSNEFVVEKSTWEYIFLAFGMVTFQFDIHPTILTVHVDMVDRKKISKVIIISFLISLSMFTITTLNVFLKFGKDVGPSILETLSTTVFLHFASIFVSIQLCVTSAISNSALYQHMEESFNISREFNHKRCILRTVLVILAIVVAESVPRFDIVMSLIGATLTSPLVFILPPLFYLKILKLKEKREKEMVLESFKISACNDEDETPNSEENYPNSELINDVQNNELVVFLSGRKGYSLTKKNIEFVLCCFIIVSSIFCTFSATYLNLLDATNFQNFSYPCIYNITRFLIK